MASPLAGLKVVELARILAGPWAGQTLSDLGAEVIKVEAPQGDDTRAWGPPFVERDGDVSAAYFHSANRGKASVTADFSTPEGQEAVRRLVADADILIENFKVGGLKKYGLDYDGLSKLNPCLIYCSITGFGQDGPYAHRAGYDFMMLSDHFVSQYMVGLLIAHHERHDDPVLERFCHPTSPGTDIAGNGVGSGAVASGKRFPRSSRPVSSGRRQYRS